jgi:hypothetical protein
MKFGTKKQYAVSILVENEASTIKEGIQEAKKVIEGIGLKVQDVKPAISKRTLTQNKALHLLFTQLAEEMVEKGIDMRTFIRVPVSFTPYSIKEYLWKPLQRALTGKNSTTQLDKTEDINLIYDNLNRIIVERTNGEIEMPPFPSLETLEDSCG